MIGIQGDTLVEAQRPGPPMGNQPRGPGPGNPRRQLPRTGGQAEQPGPPKPTLPADPKLVELHRQFVIKAEKLAMEYEQEEEYDKARDVCREILKLVPGYPKALQVLERIDKAETTADEKKLEIHANRNWQDTGVQVIQGKPIVIEASGTWTFRMSHVLDSEGMEIPKELRDFKLGSLLGVIVTGNPKENKPFFIGSGTRFVADQSGRLYMKMHDSDPQDNAGKLDVQIRGTFDRR
jgi:hypothetical protein